MIFLNASASGAFLFFPVPNVLYFHSLQAITLAMSLLQKLRIANDQFPALTGVRAIAVYMAFFQHLQLLLEPKALIGLQLSFHYCVSFFFVLSGFLITYRYFRQSRIDLKWLRNYFINRFARIYPVYFLVLTIVIIVGGRHDIVYLLQNYFLLHHLPPLIHSHGMAIAPSWSIVVEECFYLSAPFIMWFALRKQLIRPYLFFCGLLTIVLLMQNDHSVGKITMLLNSTIFGRFTEFFIGILITLYVVRKGKEEVHAKPGIRFTAIGISLILLLTLPLIYASSRMWLQYPLMIAIDNLLMPVAIAVFYIGIVYEQSFIRRLLSMPLVQVLGKGSYAFYLIHLPLIEFFGPQVKVLFSRYHNVYVLSLFLLCILLSVLVFLFWEEPWRKRIRKWAKVKV